MYEKITILSLFVVNFTSLIICIICGQSTDEPFPTFGGCTICVMAIDKHALIIYPIVIAKKLIIDNFTRSGNNKPTK